MAAGSHYTDQQRREAVAQYLLLGNVEAVAKATRIPATTLRDWLASVWWNTLSVEVRSEKGAELDGALTRIIHESTAQLLDRLKNGDPVMVAGEVRRKPVSARDLALVAAITYDKRALVRTLPEQPQDQRLSLDELARSLKAMAELGEVRDR